MFKKKIGRSFGHHNTARSCSPFSWFGGVCKQRAATLYSKGCDLKTTREHLRRGWCGVNGSGTEQFEKCNVRGCWDTALAEMNHWIAADLEHNTGDDGRSRGLTGEMGQLGGAAGWTRTDPTCTDIDDINEGDGTDIVHRLGEEAEIIAQECIEVAAAHIGGGDV